MSGVVSDNKAIVLQYVEAFNNGDLDALCRLFAPDALIHGAYGWGTIEKIRAVWGDLIQCFLVNLQVESIVCEGNLVAVRYTERGKSVAPYQNLPATGRSYELVAMEWFLVKDGLIHRRWGARDSASRLRQMGLPLD
jgi:steroid delta-isomerase-like uncharacterized protein